MSILGNNLLAQYYAQNQGLPFGYERVEYLKSTRTQYIDTNHIATDKTKIVFDFDGLNADSFPSGNNAWFFGSRIAYLNNSFGSYYNQSQSSIFADIKNVQLNASLEKSRIYNKRTILSLDSTGLVVNDTKVITTTSATFSTNNTIALLTININASISGYKLGLKIYECKIYENNALTRNLVPVIRLSDGKPGLYDLCRSICPLTGTPFYINAGTGEFVTP